MVNVSLSGSTTDSQFLLECPEVAVVRSLSSILSKRPIFFPLLTGLVFVVALSACSDDSSSPQNDDPVTFMSMIGSTPNQQTFVRAVTVLSDGTRMVCGDFAGLLHVTASSDSILSGGGRRNFLAGFQPDGSVSFMTTIGGGAVPMRSMARDRDDHLLLVGSFTGTSNFANVPLTAVNEDIIFAKLDRTGHAIWVQSGSGSGIDEGRDVTTDRDGSIYLAGSCGTGEMTVGGENVGQAGHQTGFIVKLNGDGVGVWQATGTMSAGSSTCNGVTVSEDGAVVACGFYSVGSVDFAGDVLPFDGGFFDAFIGRFRADGTPLGSIHIGGPDLVDANDVTTLDNDAVVIGELDGTADFDVTGPGGSVTASGNLNAYVARYSKTGALRWVTTFGPGDSQNGRSICRISRNQVLVCGVFLNTITLGSTTLTTNGDLDAYFARLDGNGRVVEAGRVGGGGVEHAFSCAADGRTSMIVGDADSKDLIFPGNIHRHKFGFIDSYIFQQP